jgi:WD repeat-containing protein 23
MIQPYPNSYSHPIAQFHFDPKVGHLGITFSCDPAFHSSDSANPSLSRTEMNGSEVFLLVSIPQRRPAGFMDSITSMFSSATAIATGRAVSPQPEDIFDGRIDLREDELVEGERGESEEIDDDPDPKRDLRVVRVSGHGLYASANLRRKWEVLPLRAQRAMTGSM